MKRSTKPRKVTKFSKTMEPPPFLGGRQLKDFQKVFVVFVFCFVCCFCCFCCFCFCFVVLFLLFCMVLFFFVFFVFFLLSNYSGKSISIINRRGFCGSHFVGIRREALYWQMKWG